MKKLTLALAILFASTASAHEFWLEPLHFHRAGKVLIQVGENFAGEAWKGSGKRAVRIRDTHGSQVTPMRLSGPAQVKIPGGQPGAHLLSFSNSNSFIRLQAEKFNDYLSDDGLDTALQLRKERGQEQRQGREFYQRCVKTLVQVDPVADGDATFAHEVGLPLELIPVENPYAGHAPGPITFRLLYRHRQLNNALVQVWHRADGRTTQTKLRSDERGEIHFEIWHSGRWMVSSVHMVPLTPGQKADWQSYWASYTFGYD